MAKSPKSKPKPKMVLAAGMIKIMHDIARKEAEAVVAEAFEKKTSAIGFTHNPDFTDYLVDG